MSSYRSSAHVFWRCKYHLVWTPKYRYKILTGAVGKELYRSIYILCNMKDCEILELNVQSDHVHLVVMMPPKLSLSTLMGVLKGRSAKFPNAKLAFVITTPVSLDKGMKSPNAKGFYLADYCRAAREVCEEYSIPYLDLQKVSGFNQQNIAVMTSNIAGTASDGLHPSRRGMAWIATKLAAFLQGI